MVVITEYLFIFEKKKKQIMVFLQFITQKME